MDPVFTRISISSSTYGNRVERGVTHNIPSKSACSAWCVRNFEDTCQFFTFDRITGRCAREIGTIIPVFPWIPENPAKYTVIQPRGETISTQQRFNANFFADRYILNRVHVKAGQNNPGIFLASDYVEAQFCMRENGAQSESCCDLPRQNHINSTGRNLMTEAELGSCFELFIPLYNLASYPTLRVSVFGITEAKLNAMVFYLRKPNWRLFRGGHILNPGESKVYTMKNIVLNGL